MCGPRGLQTASGKTIAWPEAPEIPFWPPEMKPTAGGAETSQLLLWTEQICAFPMFFHSCHAWRYLLWVRYCAGALQTWGKVQLMPSSACSLWLGAADCFLFCFGQAETLKPKAAKEMPTVFETAAVFRQS